MMSEKRSAIEDVDVLVSNRRSRSTRAASAKPVAVPADEAAGARQRAVLEARRARLAREREEANKTISLGDALGASDPAPAAAPAARAAPPAYLQTAALPVFDIATTREELSQLLESWLDEEIPKYVLRVMDGVSDRMISRLTTSARSKLLPRLVDLLETAHASAAASANPTPTAASSLEAGLQEMIDKIEAAQSELRKTTQTASSATNTA